MKMSKIPEGAFASLDAEAVEIPEGVTSIGNYAFQSSKIRRIKLPSTLKEIGATCFFNCMNLEEVSLPDGITHISPYTFYGCEKLKKVTGKNVTEIGHYAFTGCKSLEKLVVKNNAEVGLFALEGTLLESTTR